MTEQIFDYKSSGLNLEKPLNSMVFTVSDRGAAIWQQYFHRAIECGVP